MTTEPIAIPLIERNETLAEQAYDRLRSALASGAFKPGETLSIRRLAGLLGISATPARDAISRALWEHSLETGPNRTFLVPQLTLESLQAIYTLRINLEGLATELAARHFDSAMIRKLETIHDAHTNAVDDAAYAKALQANESFHFFVYENSGNTLLTDIIRTLWLKMGPSLNLLYPAYVDRRGQNHHSHVLAALRKRDAVAARAAMVADLKEGQAELERALTLSLRPPATAKKSPRRQAG